MSTHPADADGPGEPQAEPAEEAAAVMSAREPIQELAIPVWAAGSQVDHLVAQAHPCGCCLVIREGADRGELRICEQHRPKRVGGEL